MDERTGHGRGRECNGVDGQLSGQPRVSGAALGVPDVAGQPQPYRVEDAERELVAVVERLERVAQALEERLGAAGVLLHPMEVRDIPQTTPKNETLPLRLLDSASSVTVVCEHLEVMLAKRLLL